MKVLYTIDELRNVKCDYQSGSVAFVPTMGALHAGHLSLIDRARSIAESVIVSIFINPLQFGSNEDFTKYPRNLDKDLALLEEKGVDYVFCPSFTKEDLSKIRQIKARAELTNILCGKFRAGHFDGVVTIVNYFFELIEPDYAVFGEKDYQQLKVIEAMCEDLSLKVKIIPAEIAREESGLARSSRNVYLTEDSRIKADEIYKNLKYASVELKNILSTVENFDAELTRILERVKSNLESFGFSLDYVEYLWSRVFIAARIDGVRLIDNMEV